MSKTQEKKPDLKHPEKVDPDLTVEALKRSFDDQRTLSLAKDEYTATTHDNYMAASLAVRDRLFKRWIPTQQRYHKQNLKRVYYLSMEFLIGKLLKHNILALGIEDQMRDALKAFNLRLEDLYEVELDAGLGNGGLGRLAACFLDSMASLGIPANGYGILFNYGIFHQKILNGYQVEVPDQWLSLGTPWAIARPEYSIRVQFGGKTRHFQDRSGRLCVEWVDTDDVLALPSDVPTPGFQNGVVNPLRLWSAKGTQDFDLDCFNQGDYFKAYDKKIISENITKVLYPNDEVMAGVELRLKQEYFFCAASLADIVRRFKSHNSDVRTLPDKVAIQLNDTHPSLAVPELMRILLDHERLEWDAAWDVTVRTFAYTNHTLMPEALETWPVTLLGALLPRHLEIIYEVNARFLRDVSSRFVGDVDRLRRMSIVQEGEPKRIRMAYLSLLGSHSINGVSSLHTQLLTQTLFRDFHEMFPQRFNNKTNGVTPRRWMVEANPRMKSLIDEAIGPGWVEEPARLRKLIPCGEDAGFREKWRAMKRANKEAFAAFLKGKSGVIVNPDAIMDVQVKRIHEYKRQLLFAFFLIHHYLRLKNEPDRDFAPRTAVFGGKAAPGYVMAKRIIKFINSVAGVINGDRSIHGRLQVLFLEDYRVSIAQRVIPAADLSEQISVAGTEASGTGNMKFMMNGALTIGTLDGANVEIFEEVGEKHMFLFGLKAPEVARLKVEGYQPGEYLKRSVAMQEVIRLITRDFFSHTEPGLFMPILDSLLRWDPYMLLADIEDYLRAQDEAERRYRDAAGWTRSSILNTARSGRFSSDRTIRQYADEIWKVPTSGGR